MTESIILEIVKSIMRICKMTVTDRNYTIKSIKVCCISNSGRDRDSPVLGPITIREISSGAKALIIMNADGSVISNANSCGDNCAKLLAELSRIKDFSVFLAYPMDFGKYMFDMEISRTGAICHNKEA